MPGAKGVHPMHHDHIWRVTGAVMRDLPDPHGYADRLIAWRYACGQYGWITGHIRLGEPLRTPAFWNRLAAHLDDERHAQVVTRQGRGRGREAGKRWRTPRHPSQAHAGRSTEGGVSNAGTRDPTRSRFGTRGRASVATRRPGPRPPFQPDGSYALWSARC